MTVPFERFGPAHLGAIALTFIVPLVMAAIIRCSASGVATKLFRWLLVAVLVGDKIATLFLAARNGELTTATALPMHLCDWAALATLVTLIYPNQWSYELCYFWALGGTLQALLTPDLSYGFPDPRFISFFALHGGVIASVLFMTLGMKMRPVRTSILRALAWSAFYAATAIGANSLLGTNFGYFRAKPEHPSLLDYAAPWPFDLAELAVLAILLCLLSYAPFFAIDRLRASSARQRARR